MIAGSYAQRNQSFLREWDVFFQVGDQQTRGKFDEGRDIVFFAGAGPSDEAVYVVGRILDGNDYDAFVARLNPCTGETVWINLIDGGQGNDAANAVAVDASGNVYAAGYITVSGSQQQPEDRYNAFVVKFQPNGNAWAGSGCNDPYYFTYDPDGLYDEAVDLAVSPDGHAFVACTTREGSEFPDTDVTLLALKKCGTSAFDIVRDDTLTNDSAVRVATKGDDVLALGQVAGDFATYKYEYDSDEEDEEELELSLQWKRAFGSSQHTDVPTSLVIIASGQIYVAGSAYTNSTRNFDAVILKYDTNGDLSTSWAGNGQTPDDDTVGVRRWNGNANGNDRFNAIAATLAGHVYATGVIVQDTDDTHMGTAKYTVGGAKDWEALYSNSAQLDEGVAISVDGFGNCYVAGKSHSSSPGGLDYVAAKYKRVGNSGSGVLVGDAVERLGSPNQDIPAAIASDELHRAFITGAYDFLNQSEHEAQAKTLACFTFPLNGDVKDGEDCYNGLVDDSDLARVLEEFGFQGSGLESDLNEDGIVDDTDLAAILTLFGRGCERDCD